MSKRLEIVVFEDSVADFVRRYQSITSEHDVFLYFSIDTDSSLFREVQDDFSNLGMKQLTKLRLNLQSPEEIRATLESLAIPSAAAYFVDGLGGFWKPVLTSFPPSNSFLYSNHPMYQREARRLGYGVIPPFASDGGGVLCDLLPRVARGDLKRDPPRAPKLGHLRHAVLFVCVFVYLLLHRGHL